MKKTSYACSVDIPCIYNEYISLFVTTINHLGSNIFIIITATPFLPQIIIYYNDYMFFFFSSMTVIQSLKLGIDVNRHKEIIVKAISGILLLMLKHLKINHVYQFEYMSQQLMFANCIPLVLKFFNQNIMSYVGAKNRYGFITIFKYILFLFYINLNN